MLEIVKNVRVEVLVLAIEQGSEVAGIVGSEAKAHQGLGRSEQRLSGLGLEPVQELRGHRHRAGKFARVGQQCRNHPWPEVLRLVDDDVEWTAVRRHRAGAP